ncbi:Serine hydrolase FSH [Vigna unguiculata]|uniref:Serine hydrolase FSH n=1 Tax=Vigna unguiculata TaxID=3917 RepID=A0A4D6LQ79_VIGUN|nr:Serine hydrolase FSH [Vigna unguiculata]
MGMEAGTTSDVKGYEWFHANEDFTEYTNFEEGLAYIEDYMVNNGPFQGATDIAREEHIVLLEAFKDPIVIFHDEGHTVPKLDGKNLETVLGFILTIQRMVSPVNARL